MENAYLNEMNFPIINENFVVISGCSGGGKSTLLTELVKRDFNVVMEPGRQIVKEQHAIDGDALPWINSEKFCDLALSRYIYQFNSQEKADHFIFFDRGIVDVVHLESPQAKYFQNAAACFRYNRLVFLVPPWKEIFANDAERKHNFEAAAKEFDELLIRYKHFGYETILIPKVSVKERADFILDKLGVLTTAKIETDIFLARAKRLLEWNKEKLTRHSTLSIEDIKELFAPTFTVLANGREYDATYQNYYEFLNTFRSNIDVIDYHVQEYIHNGSTVVMPLKATVKRMQGKEDIFDAIMLIKFNDEGKIIHWQEVYSLRQ